MAVRSGPARVLTSGQATTFRGHGLAVELEDPAFRVVFAFADGEEAGVAMDPFEGGVTLTCVGLDDRPGRGSAEPVAVGQVGATVLWLHFRVFRWGASDDRTVHWTVFAVDAG